MEKLNYLNSLLERSAREAVSELALTAADYRQAIETLKKQFGCKQLIVNKHMDALLQVEAVATSQNTRGLRKLLVSVNSHIHTHPAVVGSGARLVQQPTVSSTG